MPRLSKIGAAALAAFGWTTGGASVTATYLVVAGGGGGGKRVGAGGGAGGYRTGTLSLNPSLSYTVTVGAGGAGSGVYSSIGTNGSDSTFSTVTSTGGGGGDSSNPSKGGGSGGSGGGSSDSGTAGSGNTPSTSPSQGNNGGVGSGNSPNYGAGGGGGAGATGGNGSSTVAGNGGAGTANSISGSSVTYAGGGGGGSSGGTAGSGGSGGGGAGSNADATATSGTANTGGGGGGCGGLSNSSGTTFGGAGGSGIVIISYPGSQQFSGGVVTSSGGNTIHTFTTSGTLGPITTLNASYLIVAGGAGGGAYAGGGGGAGGVLSGSGVTIDPNSTYLVTVGAGGASVAYGTASNSGSNSSFSMVATAAVGGGRGSYGGGNTTNSAASGGSGGGGGSTAGQTTGGSGTSGQGYAGGNSPGATGNFSSGGGGGAGGVGSDGVAGGNGGAGGVGVASSISGTSTYYAGGGGGGSYSGSGGAGGNGGGGAGGSTPVSGTANTGGGGGGNVGASGPAGSAGGSGIVIISYPGSTQQMAGGTVTIVGGNVIHTFTSTGYLAPIKYVSNSLRFRSSASAYLSRTPTTTSNRKTWTWSGWIKLGAIGQWEGIFNAGSSGNQFAMYLYTDNTLYIQDYTGSNNIYLQTTQVFRDPAAWYHIVFAVDTTQATSTNRFKLYVNGVQVTSFVSTTYPSQNYDTQVNSTSYQNNIGLNYQFGTSNAKYFDGYMTEINFIDGQALTPSSFGTFNSYGVWQPITYGGSYGTNGFYLPFNTQTSSYVGSFNGSNQYLTVPANAAFNMGSGDFTVEAFVYFSASGRQIIQSQTSSSGSNVDASFFIERTSSNYLNFGVFSGGSNYYATGTTTIPTGKWVHVAGVRSGNTIYSYMDGVLQGTASVTGVSLNSSVYNLQISGYGGATGLFVNGYVSNLRIVKGTAVYTGNFTPPTSALSAISGTSLLTLQNASIVDNSTNAFTITNNNTVTTGQTYPFAYGIFNDKSPQGNNWTPNNVSGAFGTTLDYMTDVPTLTSATAANYNTLNPAAPGTGTISNANLTSTSTTTTVYSFAGTMLLTTGKWYWEVTATTINSGNQYPFIGAYTVPIPNSLTGAVRPGADSGIGGFSLRQNGNFYYNGNTSGTITTSFTTGDVIGIAFDVDAQSVTYYKNGSSIGTQGSLGAGPWVTAVSEYNGSLSNHNFGQRPFTYTPPSGYVALNTYNM